VLGYRALVAISDERALENELRFRSANDQIDQRRRELELDGRTPYLCECEDRDCTKLIRLTLAEYAGIRANRGQFVIAPGHPSRGAPVEHCDGYVIVVKGDA
jgi:hypothetical protein